MALKDAAAGPDDMFSTKRLPSRGQYQTLALLACELFGIEPPANRLEATVAICRMQMTPKVPEAPKVQPL